MNNIRHSGLFSVPETASVTVIGAGGLGATTALTLAKMGYRFITLYDGDEVAAENTGTQLHKPSDIGRFKVDALADTLHEFSDDVLSLP
jgi:sulfur carrier protein ThiS adenylyltransferase